MGIQAETVGQVARQVLALKYRIKQEHKEKEESRDEIKNFHSAGQSAFVRDLYAQSLTVLNNRAGLIPLKDLERTRIACLAVNKKDLTGFQKMAGSYTRTDNYFWPAGAENSEKLIEKLSAYDLVLTGLYPGHSAEETEKFLSDLIRQTKVILSCFSDPASLEVLEPMVSGSETSGPDGLILAYRQNPMTERLWVQLVFGAIGGRGRLPLAIGDRYYAGQGISTSGGLRLQYGFAENAGLCSGKINFTIDSIVKRGLEVGAYPGCQVIVARKGIVVFHKAYGYHSYDRRIEVRKDDLYDLASVTKISGPLSGLMLLEGMGKFSHQDRLGDYCRAMKGSDKASLELKDVLAHRAGLYPWIAYHEKTLKKDGQYRKRFIRRDEVGKFTVQVADQLYLSNTFKEKKIFKEIRKSELGEQKYLYSGLSFFLFPTIIEELTGEPYETFLSEHIYHRLGAWELLYRPRRVFSGSRIVPTEYDSLFRKQLIHGYVHDEGAALMGAFAGNAGLFASANDLLKLVEMYRRMGSYGGEQIIEEEVLREYSSYQFPELEIRRGLGFDKPLLNDSDGTPKDYPCPGASPASFGHSGFTGTFVWADPEHEISYVFLCNRVHPTRQNGLLYDLDIRTNILQSVYDSIMEP
jgi:CubicO group peptidase (beta-lactamase class C family)